MAATDGRETIAISDGWTRIGSGSVTEFAVQLIGAGEVDLKIGTSEPGGSSGSLQLNSRTREASLTLDASDNLYALAIADNGGAGCVVGWMAK